MSVKAQSREMASERIAPGMLPRVLNSFDMTVIFVAIVLFIVNASALQPAGQAAFTYWILGFLAFLIPGALVTSQLGQMFPQEGSLYVWTQKALGPFWGFFAGFCAWWPGVLVMVATGDAVVTVWQFVDAGSLTKAWEQGLVILAILWFSAGMSALRLRFTQSYVNVAVLFYGAAVFVIGLAGVLWVVGSGHAATSGWGTLSNWGFHSSSWTLFGLVILALLGIEVPLNLGVEIVHLRSIRKYLFWGSIVVMVAYLWATLGTMLSLNAAHSQADTTDILRAVQVGFWSSHTIASVVGLVLIWFFVSNTIVYNYSFSQAAVRLRTRAADAQAARAGQRAQQGPGLRDHHADGALVAVRHRGLQPRAWQRQHAEGLLALPGGRDRHLVPLDGAAVRGHLPRQTRLPREVRGGPRRASVPALRERRGRNPRFGVRRLRHLPQSLDAAVSLEQLAPVARVAVRGVGPDGGRDLRDQRTRPSARKRT